MIDSLLEWARQCRGVFREVRARLRLIYCNARFPAASSPEEVRSAVGARLKNRQGAIKALLILPINNWEAELKAAFESVLEVQTLEIPAIPFFASRREWARFFDDINQRVINFFESAYEPSKANLVFCYVSAFHVCGETIQKLKRPNTVVVNFNWDDLLWFAGEARGQPIGVRRIAPYFDLNLSFSHRALAQYRSVGAIATFWDSVEHGAAEHRQVAPIIPRALFVGSCYGRRKALVAAIRAAGIPIDVFGAGWGTRQVSAEELPSMYSQYAVTVGLGTTGDSYSLSCIKGRDFEVPLNGGLYLTNNHPELKFCYDVGSEVLSYETFEQCAEIIREVLQYPDRYVAIRRAGAAKAVAKHRWEARIRFLTDLIRATA